MARGHQRLRALGVWFSLGALLVAAAIVLYYETRTTTLWQDEWVWALYRRGNDAGTFLRPHNQHLSLIPIALYRVLFATAGLGDDRPYRALVVAAHLGCVALLFVYSRRRVGSLGALCAAALILFLGPAWGNIIWPFQVAWLISLSAGLGALLMLDRVDRRGNAVACALLLVSLASSGIGVVVMLGILVELLWGRRWRELWVVAGPAALYALWWVTYQQTGATSQASVLPRFVANEVASAVAAVAGLAGNTNGVRSGTLLTFGRPLALIALGLLVWRLARLRRPSPRLLALLTMAGSFWSLTAVNRAFIGASQAWASRYLYVGGLLIVLIAVELAQGLSWTRSGVVLLGAVVAAAVISNFSALRDGASYLRDQAQLTRAELGAMDITRSIVKPTYVSLVPNFPFPVVLAGPYFAAERAYGSPAATPAQIASAPQAARDVADSELIAIHQIRVRPAGGNAAPPHAGRCVSSGPPGVAGSSQLQVTVPPTGLVLKAQGGRAAVSVRRFANRFVPVGVVLSAAPGTVRISPDLAKQPWQLRVTGVGRVTICDIR